MFVKITESAEHILLHCRKYKEEGICHLSRTCSVAGAYNGGGRQDSSVRVIKNAPTTSKADIWLL